MLTGADCRYHMTLVLIIINRWRPMFQRCDDGWHHQRRWLNGAWKSAADFFQLKLITIRSICFARVTKHFWQTTALDLFRRRRRRPWLFCRQVVCQSTSTCDIYSQFNCIINAQQACPLRSHYRWPVWCCGDKHWCWPRSQSDCVPARHSFQVQGDFFIIGKFRCFSHHLQFHH